MHKIPTVEDVLAFIPKGRLISPREWKANMESAGYDIYRCQSILRRLLDPEDLHLVNWTSKGYFENIA